MPYQCLEPLIHDGKAYGVGEKIPEGLISSGQAAHLVEVGVLEETREKLSGKEHKAIEDKAVNLAKTPDLQSQNVEEVLDRVNEQEHLATLYRWQIQEKEGKARKTVLNALKRRVSILEAL